MRIIGQSTLADGSPYVHLGYIAAVVYKVDNRLLGGGAAALLVGGVIMILSLATSKARPRLTVLRFVRRRLWLMACGLLVIAAGGLTMKYATAHPKATVLNPRMFTHLHMERIYSQTLERKAQGKSLPADMAEARPMLDADTYTFDGWMHEMRLVRRVEGDKLIYSIVSAGPDGQFDTADDVRFDVDLTDPAFSRSSPQTHPASRPAEGR